MENTNDNPRIYTVFVRNWYRRENGKIVPAYGARKTTLEKGLTYDEARRLCENYNSTHKPGVLSRKAEFSS
jgi:hypothetical protein